MSTAVLRTGDRLADFRGDSGEIVRAKSPLRISFAGGGTDIPAYYNERGGAVLSSTINRYAYVTLYPRDDRQVRVRSLDLGYTVNYGLEEQPAFDGVLDLAKAVIARVGLERGVDIDIRSDAPAGSGLGGSSALTSALIGAIAEFKGVKFSPYEFAELNYVVEREDLGIAGGKQDQYATTFGGFNHIEFTADSVLVNPLRIDNGLLNDLEAHLLLCFVGKVRSNLNLVAKQVDFYKEGRETTIDSMERICQLVGEMKHALLRGKLDDFGRLLHEGYVNKKLMNPHVTEGTKTDRLYAIALEKGAIGGKLLGAGGGGYFAIYCPTDCQHEVRAALEADGAQFADFTFDGHGLQVWRSKSR
jgi:D-glycero-alpha-D-manno-heptose-7-phosphate kinase